MGAKLSIAMFEHVVDRLVDASTQMSRERIEHGHAVNDIHASYAAKISAFSSYQSDIIASRHALAECNARIAKMSRQKSFDALAYLRASLSELGMWRGDVLGLAVIELSEEAMREDNEIPF